MPNEDKQPASADSFDVLVIGGGPAGYPAAIRAAQNKLSVACIDEWKNHDGTAAFGGTCLNAGCIPSKALLESTELYHRVHEEFTTHGIKVTGTTLDLAQMQKRKSGIVRTMTQGILALFKAAGVTPLQGHGKLLAGRKVEFTAHDGKRRVLSAKQVVLASGSTPIELRSAPFKNPEIVDSWGALEFDAVPKRLGVIGAGVIGLELGSVWRRLGSEVVVLEALPEFLAIADQQLAKEALRHFKKQGLDIRLGAKVTGAKLSGAAVQVAYTDAKGEQQLTVDRVVVAIGRRPFTKDLLAADTGVQLDERGFVKVDDHCRTGVDGRVGDRRLRARPDARAQGQGGGRDGGGPHRRPLRGDQLQGHPFRHLHRARDRLGGTDRGAGQGERPRLQGRRVPVPRQRPRAGDGSRRGASPRSSPRAMTMRSWACTSSARWPGELIAEAVLAMEYSASTEDLQRTIHAHPTLSEAVHEAALAADKRSIDSVNR